MGQPWREPKRICFAFLCTLLVGSAICGSLAIWMGRVPVWIWRTFVTTGIVMATGWIVALFYDLFFVATENLGGKSRLPDVELNADNAWRDLIYKLFYPGVLGSMIFDILDPLRDFSAAHFGLACIALIFVGDYWHMTNNLKAPGNRKSLPLIDFLIALSFCASYFLLTHVTDLKVNQEQIPAICFVSVVFLLSSFVGIFVYEYIIDPVNSRRGLLSLLPLLPCVGGVVVFLSSDFDKILVSVFIDLFAMLAYLVYVSTYAREGFKKCAGEVGPS